MVKIIVGVVAVMIFLGLVSAVAIGYVIYRAKQKVVQIEKQVQTTYPMPTGTREVRTQPVAPPAGGSVQEGPVVDTGVPIYPEATASGGSGQMTLGAATVKTQQYTTTDSVDKVTAFYKDKMGPTARVIQSGNQAMVQVVGASGVITIGISPDSSSGKTKIAISNMTK